MFLLDIVVAMLVAVGLGLLLHVKFGWRHPRMGSGSRGSAESLIYLISVLFGFSWAGGVWLPPMGPSPGGSPFMAPLLTGAFIALLLAATCLKSKAYGEADSATVSEKRKRPAIFGAYFAMLHLALIVFVIVGYLV